MKALAVNLAQTNKKVLLAGGVILIAGVWTSVAVIHNKRTKRDQLAIAFFSELQRDIAPDTVGLIESNAFNIQYWKDVAKKVKKPYYLLTESSAKAYAKDIRDSWGIFDDNEDKIKGVFRAVKDKAQVSQIAFWYYAASGTNKINLIDDLKGRLSTAEVGEMLEIVKKMPDYRVVETKK